MARRVRKITKKCRFQNREAKARAIRKFMRKYGDDIPEQTIKESTSGKNLDKWVTECVPGEGLAGAMRYAHSDWYLCTLKNAAVRKDLRGKKIGSKVYEKTTEKALRDKKCMVLAADVNYDNIASKRLLEKNGFDVVNRFCWSRDKKAKPADIMHYVKIPPRKKNRTRC